MTFETLRNLLIEQLGVAAETITPASLIREDLGADSLDMVEIVMEIENETGCDIPDSSAEMLLTVQAFLDYVNA